MEVGEKILQSMLILKPSKERFLPVSMRNINGSKNINGEKKKIEVNSRLI